MLDLDKMFDDWKSPLVARSKIVEFTKGLYKHNTMSVYDSLGSGVTPRFRANRKIFYFTKDVINWLRSKKKGANRYV